MNIVNKLIVPALALLLCACTEEVAHVGAPAPEIAAVDLRGEPVKLERWQGKSVFLSFWSATCGACIAEMPYLEALSREYRGKVEVVAINIDPGDASLQPILERQGVSFPVVRDSLGMTRERYLVVGTPTAFMIGADGIVKGTFVGAPPKARLVELFDEAARGS